MVGRHITERGAKSTTWSKNNSVSKLMVTQRMSEMTVITHTRVQGNEKLSERNRNSLRSILSTKKRGFGTQWIYP